jgi:hypothetical protein
MKWMIGFIILIMGSLILGDYWESTRDPYEEGMHMRYSIVCENGWVYKVLDRQRGTHQVFNSDGTPTKCGEKRK